MEDVYFRAFYSYLEQMEDLSDAEFGRVMKAAMIYAQSGEKPENLTPTENMAFKFIKWNVDSSNTKDANVSEARSRAVKTRWNKRNNFESTEIQSDTKNTNVSFVSDGIQKIQSDTNRTNDTEEEKEEEKEEEEIISISNEIDSAPDGAGRTPHKKIMELFNKTCPSFPKIKNIEGQRMLHVSAQWKKHPDLNFFETLFQKAEESDFLTGRSGKWRASFDWIVRPSNVTKIIEGNYENKTAPQNEFEQSSFDTDEYMLSALKRTYGSKEEETEENNG